MRLALLVFGGLIVLVVVLGGVLFVVGRGAVERFQQYGSDPVREREVAGRIAHFQVPGGYNYASSFDFGATRTVSLVSADGSTQFTLMGSTAPQDIGYLASATALKVSACGGMERLPDIRTRAEGKTFVSEIFKCRGKPYRIGFTRVHGRMTDTIVTIVAPPNDWPSHDLVTLLGSIRR